jgi:hypothetical protein
MSVLRKHPVAKNPPQRLNANQILAHEAKAFELARQEQLVRESAEKAAFEFHTQPLRASHAGEAALQERVSLLEVRVSQLELRK